MYKSLLFSSSGPSLPSNHTNSLQSILIGDLLAQNNRQELVVRDVLDLCGDGTTRFQKQRCVRPRTILLRQNVSNTIVFLQHNAMQYTDGTILLTQWTRANIDLAAVIRAQRLEILLGATVHTGAVNKTRRTVHLIAEAEIACVQIVRWRRAFVFNAMSTTAHIALANLVRWCASGRVLAAFDIVRRGRCHFNEIVGKQLAPGGQHGGNVRMLLRFIDRLLHASDNVLWRR